ncbi:bifunctional DNA-formamidopyrimidine glycosylase/DNA-(apurinic or apyrimidinic site) lyase [Christensenella intestinihominis]|uniref:bifunctional DNA-formamidopyrimidine glycosylase/DNA-(apurinic or apyrimidinic site) lyase n=1 Tax=Christensenella intestinihominis TaxID=1851429 RepID=UPI000835B0FC|nr:bifunctional DNA-formamidopyrimidine glycosylase/DNA-(apurinic or apyrimidinic site) lyase [Christensenella intestinihominis]
MPELPEVETIRRVLEPQLAGRTITGLRLNRPDIISHPSAEAFQSSVAGARIKGMDRRGKFLFIRLEGKSILLHLRMTGRLLLVPSAFPEEKHTHIVFGLDNGAELRFVDPRRFGRFWLVRDGEEDTESGVHKLGPEPFDPALSAAYLQASCGQRKKAVKECLLDQSIVAGIGNIYADEILFVSKIRPERPANSLSKAEWKRLAENIPERLRYFIEKNAVTPEEYLAGNGTEYRNTPFLQVYGHEGEPCPVCGAPLCRTVIAGRGSIFCPRCQKEKRR